MRDIWDKALPYDSKNITLGVDCTIMTGCPVSMILGSHAMKVFGILDDKSKKQTLMGNDDGKIVVSHMSDQAWMTRNHLTKSIISPINVILNQLDNDIAESNYRNSITFTPPATHRLAVLASLLKSTNLDRLSRGEISELDTLDMNDISITSVQELAVRLSLTKGSLETLIKEVEQFGKRGDEADIQEHKDASMDNSLVSSGKLLGTVGKRVGQSMWGSFINMMSVGEKESANDVVLDANASTSQTVEVTEVSETVAELKSYSKLSKSAKANARLMIEVRMLESKGVIDEDISDEVVLEARTQAAASRVLFEEACESERVKVIKEAVAHKLNLRSAIEAFRVTIEEWGIPIDDDISLLADDYSLCSQLEGKPDLFPVELWKYVADDVKPHVCRSIRTISHRTIN